MIFRVRKTICCYPQEFFSGFAHIVGVVFLPLLYVFLYCLRHVALGFSLPARTGCRACP